MQIYRTEKNGIKRRFSIHIVLIAILAIAAMSGIANTVVAHNELAAVKEQNAQLVDEKQELHDEINNLRVVLAGYHNETADDL